MAALLDVAGPAARQPPDAPERVLGWDVLRGLCAVAVALYHLLHWQDVVTLNTLGSYGVYLFFVLSGASLAYNYSGRLSGPRDAAAFLLIRWLRLAPLYILVCLAFVSFYSLRNGQLIDQVPLRLLLNASFAFGAHDPAVWALAIGGWSLGIEFIYYLAFPVLLLALPHLAWSALIAVTLCLLQWAWIYGTAGSPAGYTASSVAYHQVPAFAAYFFGGCIIGHWRRASSRPLPEWAGILVWLLMAVLLLWLNPAREGDELLAARGASLFCASFAVVLVSGQVAVGARLAPVARWLGDITYGCYLLHPLFFFGLTWFLLPRLGLFEISEAPLLAKFALLATVLALSCLTAAASERWFEAPLRRWGKRMLRRRAPPAAAPYSDAASISS